MAQLQAPINLGQIEPQTGGGGQLPVGEHNVVVVDSEVSAAKSGQSGYLKLTLQIIDGEHQGATGPYRLNIYNESQQATQIALGQLSAVGHVIGVLDLQDSAQLHNMPFRAMVRLQKSPEAQEKGYTEVYGVKDINGNAPSKNGPPQQGGGQAQPQNNAQNNQNWSQPQGGQNQPQQPPQDQGASPWQQPQQPQQSGNGQAPWQQPQQPQQTNAPWGNTNG